MPVPSRDPARGDRWVCLDIGETLVDETRVWTTWARVLGVPSLTLMALLGAGIRQGEDHRAVLPLLAEDWRHRVDEAERAYGAFREEDLYPDARRGVAGLSEIGYRVAIAGNQPARRSAELRALGLRADVVVMSEELGAEKPSPGFFERILDLLGAEPSRVAYVGDRVDNDVTPAAAAGLRAVWLRRGPWGLIQSPPRGVDFLEVGSLDELVERLPRTPPPIT